MLKKSFPWVLTVVNILIAIVFSIVFFDIMSKLPDILPVHWSVNSGSVDRWGAKSELYSLAIIPTVVAGIAFITSIPLLIKKKCIAVVYISNGISLFLLAIMIMASALIISKA